MIKKPAQISFHFKRLHTCTSTIIIDNINMDSTITGSVNADSHID